MSKLQSIKEISEVAGLTRQELKEAYLADGRPWVVAFSGGKDSTLVLQLVYELLVDLGERAFKPVHIISSDTQVEAPNIVEYVKTVLSAVVADAKTRGLPVSAELVQPEIRETFWSKLIGRGYPPPTRWFRWCTSNMKIKPSRRAIKEITTKYGSVILLLGSRKAESSQRKRTMEGRVSNHRNLNSHHDIPNAYVLAPIAAWSDDEVWEYLYRNNPPLWNNAHDHMLGLYRQAVGGECPVVMDLSTPSCGGSRFGCWTCTVVKSDKSMEGFIQNGEDWMQPLATFRNWLKEYREQSGVRLEQKRDGSAGLGPFTAEARYEILRRLLECEQTVCRQLISDDELYYIQSVWSQEFDLNEAALTLAIQFQRSVQRGYPMPLDSTEQEKLEDIAIENELNPDIISSILALEGEFPNLDRWGAKPELRRKIKDLITTAEASEASQA